MNRITAVCFCLVFIPALVLSFPWVDDSDGYEEGESNNKALRMFPQLERRSGGPWCARWGEFCVSHPKSAFTRCCSGLRCMCGKFWAQHQCQCKTNSLFG